MVFGSTNPSPIHRHPLFLPCPASTATSTSKSSVDGSEVSPFSSLNFESYATNRASATGLTQLDPVTGSGLLIILDFRKEANGFNLTPILRSCKRVHACY